VQGISAPSRSKSWGAHGHRDVRLRVGRRYEPPATTRGSGGSARAVTRKCAENKSGSPLAQDAGDRTSNARAATNDETPHGARPAEKGPARGAVRVVARQCLEEGMRPSPWSDGERLATGRGRIRSRLWPCSTAIWRRRTAKMSIGIDAGSFLEMRPAESVRRPPFQDAGDVAAATLTTCPPMSPPDCGQRGCRTFVSRACPGLALSQVT